MALGRIALFVLAAIVITAVLTLGLLWLQGKREENQRLEMTLDHEKQMAREDRDFDSLMEYVEEDSRSSEQDEERP